MKCSVELPIAHLEMSDLFDYDFVIASTCLAHPEYKKYYLDHKDPNRSMTLDNGAFETGEAIDDETYLNLARELKPDILVIPDVYLNPGASLDRFADFMQEWKKNPVPEAKLMGVIQANGSLEMAHMMGLLYNSHGIEWIGVPYACKLDRYQLISSHPEWTNVHILGLPTLSEVIGLNPLYNVKSVDSSLPVKITKDGHSLGNSIYSNSYVKSDESVSESVLRSNLQYFTCVCNDNVEISVINEDGGEGCV